MTKEVISRYLDYTKYYQWQSRQLKTNKRSLWFALLLSQPPVSSINNKQHSNCLYYKQTRTDCFTNRSINRSKLKYYKISKDGIQLHTWIYIPALHHEIITCSKITSITSLITGVHLESWKVSSEERSLLVCLCCWTADWKDFQNYRYIIQYFCFVLKTYSQFTAAGRKKSVRNFKEIIINYGDTIVWLIIIPQIWLPVEFRIY